MDPHSGTGLLDLPDEILQVCFARLPIGSLPSVNVVCKRLRKLGNAGSVRVIRRRLGLLQACTIELHKEYVDGEYRGLQGRAFVPQCRRVHRIATLRAPQRLQYGATGADGLLYVLGGRSPLECRRSKKAWVVYSRVDVYEGLGNVWYEKQPMLVGRYSFAVGTLVDLITGDWKVIVAGGYDAEGEALSLAEVYDSSKGRWEGIPSMKSIAGPCKGEVFNGKFHVQQANSGFDTIEIYDSACCRWEANDSQESKFCPKPSSEKNATYKSVILEL